MGFFRQIQTNDFLDIRRTAPGTIPEIASGHVGVKSGAADILSHLLDHQHIDDVKQQFRHQFTRAQQQYGLAVKQGFCGNLIDNSQFVMGVFYQSDTKQKGLFRHDRTGGFGQEFLEIVHSVIMKFGGADDLSHPDGHHLDNTAFDGSTEIGVGFDPADQYHTFGLVGIAIHKDPGPVF